MTVDEDHALGDEVVGDGNGLLRIAGVVADFELELLAEHAARSVDVGNRLLGASLELDAEGGVVAGDRTGGSNRDVGVRHARQRGRERHNSARHEKLLHANYSTVLIGDQFPAGIFVAPAWPPNYPSGQFGANRL